MLSSNQRGRGQEPVMVQGRMVLAVTVNMAPYLIPVRPVCKAREPAHVVLQQRSLTDKRLDLRVAVTRQARGSLRARRG